MPNNCQGWGRVLLDDALFFTGDARTLFVADDPGFAQGAAGQTKTFTSGTFLGNVFSGSQSTTQTVDISAFAGQSVRILISTADLGTASLVEAAVDDVVITRQ